MKAYQTVLFPYLAPVDVQLLNQLGLMALVGTTLMSNEKSIAHLLLPNQ